MGLEKLVPISGLMKSRRELTEVRTDDSIADGMKYQMKAFEVIGVGLLNLGYVAGAVIGAYYLMNG